MQQLRTGAGTATFHYDGKLYFDGKTPKDPGDDDDEDSRIIARLLNVPLARVQEARRLRIIR